MQAEEKIVIKEKLMIEDDDKETVTLMIEHRLPWLVIGLFGGIMATLLTARFEAVLSENIQLAFFIPVIVYMADAVGTQTETVYVRNLTTRKVKFHVYLIKELILGLSIGALFGAIIGSFAYLWFHVAQTALTVGFAMFLTMGIAPVVSLVVPTIIKKEHKDPAVGAGPFTTVIQDLISLSVYFFIATMIIF